MSEVNIDKLSDELLTKIKEKGELISKSDLESLKNVSQKFSAEEFFNHMNEDCQNPKCALHQMAQEEGNKHYITGFAQGRAFQAKYPK